METRPYTLKRYRDGTFELSGNADVSKVRMQYSSSSGVYFTTISVQLPSELGLDTSRRVQLQGGSEGAGIYNLSLNGITSSTLTLYLSANEYAGEIPYIASSFTLKGIWK